MNKIFDPVRRRYVADSPEERVRQALLKKMIAQLGYPIGWIAVERRVGNAGRRLDWFCAYPAQELIPLIIGECKAHPLSVAAREQALGYNFSLKAPFLCIATPDTTHTLWREEEKICMVPFLLPFDKLLEQIGRERC